MPTRASTAPASARAGQATPGDLRRGGAPASAWNTSRTGWPGRTRVAPAPASAIRTSTESGSPSSISRCAQARPSWPASCSGRWVTTMPGTRARRVRIALRSRSCPPSRAASVGALGLQPGHLAVRPAAARLRLARGQRVRPARGRERRRARGRGRAPGPAACRPRPACPRARTRRPTSPLSGAVSATESAGATDEGPVTVIGRGMIAPTTSTTDRRHEQPVAAGAGPRRGPAARRQAAARVCTSVAERARASISQTASSEQRAARDARAPGRASRRRCPPTSSMIEAMYHAASRP